MITFLIKNNIKNKLIGTEKEGFLVAKQHWENIIYFCYFSYYWPNEGLLTEVLIWFPMLWPKTLIFCFINGHYFEFNSRPNLDVVSCKSVLNTVDSFLVREGGGIMNLSSKIT